MAKNHIDDINKANIKKLRGNIRLLPSFVSEFFIGIADTTSIYTRIGYTYDLKLFFEYLISEEPSFYKENIKEFTFSEFKKITATNIREFLDYLSYYTREVQTHDGHTIYLEATNTQRGKSRKLSAIRSIFLFFANEEKIKYNPAMLVKTPKIHEKAIIALDVNEVCTLLDEIDSGDNLTVRQKGYHTKTRKRDLCLVMLILGTGMRISECVNIDIKKVDLENMYILITRKGGKESFVYFNEEVYEVLYEYIDERRAYFMGQNKDTEKPTELLAKEFLEQPLFTSLQDRRINVRTVQNLVKKYSQLATPLKNISPHKLRSTYATNLYRETHDIYLVADALGHADVNTTRKHYAKLDDEQRRKASKYVQLR